MGGDSRGYDSYASRALNERCLVYRPVPVRSSGYNNNNQIVQGPGYVAMMQEQIHETRIIPLDGRPFTGDASGRGSASRVATGKATRWSSRPGTSIPIRTTRVPARTVS